MKCNKCGAELKSGAKFCTVCGEKVEVQRICPNCGKPIKDGAKFCRECGAAVNTFKNPAPQAQPTPVKTEQVRYADPAPVKTGKNKAAIGIIAAVVAVVVVAVAVGAAAFTKFIKSKSSAGIDYSLYVKDNELYLADAENEPVRLTNDFFGSSLIRECRATPTEFAGVYEYDIESGSERYGDYEYSDCASSEENKWRIDEIMHSLCQENYDSGVQLYPDRIELSVTRLIPTDGSKEIDQQINLRSFELCYYRLGSKNTSPVTIASDVTKYSLCENGSLVAYTTGDNTLYTYDLNTDKSLRIGKGLSEYEFANDYSTIYFCEQSGRLYSVPTISESAEADCTLIFEDVKRFTVSDDGKSVIFSSGHDYYIIIGDGPVEKMGYHFYGDAVYESEDHRLFYYTDYTDSYSLYKFTLDKGEEMIAENIDEVLSVSESGEVYYLVSEEGSLSLADFIIDDMAEQDRPIAEEYGDGLGEWYYYNEEGDYDVWQRDNLRREVYGEYQIYSGKSLYCYDGSTVQKIAENIVGKSYSGPGVAFTALDASAPQVKMSEAWTHSHLYDNADGTWVEFDTSYLDKFIDTYMVIGNKAYKVSDSSTSEFSFTNSCDAFYVLDNLQEQPGNEEGYREEPIGDLYRIPIVDNAPGEAELYNTEVSAVEVGAVGDSDVFYFKNVQQYSGDFYVNKDLLAYSLSIDSGYNFIEETGELLYQGADGVYSYKDGKTVFLGEDANVWPDDDEEPYTESAFFEEDGNVYLLDDNGNKILIDNGVSLLI